MPQPYNIKSTLSSAKVEYYFIAREYFANLFPSRSTIWLTIPWPSRRKSEMRDDNAQHPHRSSASIGVIESPFFMCSKIKSDCDLIVSPILPSGFVFKGAAVCQQHHAPTRIA
jgi:hypothetical protein